jgi:hypothetical protein
VRTVFEGVLTTDTYVLGWHREAERLVFDVEASLWPEHPDYEPPRPGEWTCYKPARLVFEGVESVANLPDMASVPRSTDANGSQDFGSLSELAADASGFVIAGDFGVVRVFAASVRLEVAAGPNHHFQQTGGA